MESAEEACRSATGVRASTPGGNRERHPMPGGKSMKWVDGRGLPMEFDLDRSSMWRLMALFLYGQGGGPSRQARNEDLLWW